MFGAIPGFYQRKWGVEEEKEEDTILNSFIDVDCSRC
jgi:hypothetical protein